MEINFYKYQGTGNDFILIDNRELQFPSTDYDLVQKLCHRQFGIGADGLMLLERSDRADFKMIYYNADGKIGSMCGNGGRCIVAFAHQLGLIENNTCFEAPDGLHQAQIKNNWVTLEMSDVDEIKVFNDYVFLDTGSPHHVCFKMNLEETDVYQEGKLIRNGAPYFEKGTNVNFVEIISENELKVRTYERGVENETLSCGTGVTASAISAAHLNHTKKLPLKIQTLGGNLEINFFQDKEQSLYKNITLSGPATFVFKGVYSL
ncbi:diaminopimelate epimerase [Namhaeicola litoreus]|uniref:Diaminopimelate epimerase n=1 Tax=Namhaeicola litoreus TaxID=1052145 RepID=A0ABW3Y320_9FLAO